MPSISLGTLTTVYTPPTTPSQPSASNAIVDTNQYEAFSTSFTGSSGTGGGGPYTYNWIISNAVTGASVNTLTFSNAFTTNTITLQIPSYFTTNSPLKANVIVTDQNPTTVNSVYSSNFLANPVPLASLISNINAIDLNQIKTFNLTVTGGSPPFTFNIVAYNPSHSLAYNSLTTSSPNSPIGSDILVLHNNGTETAYYFLPTVSNAIRGNVLVSVFNGIKSYDKVFLGSDNFSICPTTTQLQPMDLGGSNGNAINVSVYGSGETKSVISCTLQGQSALGMQGNFIALGSNDLIANLQVRADVFGVESHNNNWGNDTFRSVFFNNSHTVDIFYPSTTIHQTGNIIIQNSTLVYNWDSTIDFVKPFYVFDSSYTVNALNQSNGISSTNLLAHGPTSGGGSKTFAVNDIVYVTGPNQVCGIYSTQASSNVIVYGGTITTGQNGLLSGSVCATSSGVVNLNNSVTYNSAFEYTASGGTINTFTGGFGAYSYQKTLTYPAISNGVVTLDYILPSNIAGTWTANFVVTDNGLVSNSLSTTYLVNSALTIPTLSPGTAFYDLGQIMSQTGSWTGGTSIYTFNWIVTNIGGTSNAIGANVSNANGVAGGTKLVLTDTSNALNKVWVCSIAWPGSSGFAGPNGGSITNIFTNSWVAGGIIGYSLSNSTCGSRLTGAGHQYALAEELVGINSSVLYMADLKSSGSGTANTFSLPYNVPFTTNVLIMIECSVGNCDNSPQAIATGNNGLIVPPANCGLLSNGIQDYFGNETSAAYICRETAGSYSLNIKYAPKSTTNDIQAVIFNLRRTVILPNGTATGLSNSISNALVVGNYNANLTISDNSVAGSVVQNSINYALTVNPAFLSTSWVASNNPINMGQTQTLTGTISGGTAPIGNVINVYNAIGSLVWSSQPDVLVAYSNGIKVGYNATANTNFSRGTALEDAFTTANMATGESVYLKAEVYDLGTNQISLSGPNYNSFTNVNLYGAGKYNTIIKDEFNGFSVALAVITAGENSIVSDLSIKTALGLYNYPWGIGASTPNTAYLGNDILRNVYIQADSDGIYLRAATGTPIYGNFIIENVTVKTLWDTYISSGLPSSVFIFDSHFSTNGTSTLDTGQGRSIVLSTPGAANVYSINSSFVGYSLGLYQFGSNALFYGGNIMTTNAVGNDIDIVSGHTYINATFSYNSVKVTGAGSISNTLGAYGSYSYQRYPMPVPLASSASFTQNSAWGTGTFTANIVSNDSATTQVTVSNSLTYTVNNALSANTPLLESNTIIDSGQSSTLTAGATGGTPPYTFHWFSQASCAGTSFGSGSSISVSPLVSNTYSFNAVDSATTPNSICSASNTVTVNSAPTLTSLDPSNTILTYGQSVTYNVVLNGGTGPFTLNLINGGTVVNTITWPTLTPISNVVTFGANVPALGSQTFNVVATDTGATTPYAFNSMSNTITVSTPTSTTTIPSGGGGNSPPTQTLTLKDNLTASAASSAPVFTIYITNSSGTSRHTYSQDSLPATITYVLPATSNFTFACSFSSGSATYQYAGIIYGIGVKSQCGTNYTEQGGSYTVLYTAISNPNQTTTSTTTTAATTTTTLPLINSTYNVTSAPINVKIGGAGSISISSNSPISISLKITNVTNSIIPITSNITVAAFNVVAVTSQNVIVNQSLILTITLKYSCSLQTNTLAPYKLTKAGSWIPIRPFTSNSSACTVTFHIPSDPVVALFQSIKSASTSTAMTSISTTATSTVPATSTQKQKSGIGFVIAIAAVVVILIVAILAYYLFRKNSKRVR
jgi:hypothetical protein